MGTQGHSTDIVFLSGVRTGFGSFGGTLKDLSATDLAVVAGREAIARSGVAAADVDHVIFGNAVQTSADAIYLARHAGLRAGVPQETPAVTVNRLCGSGFESIIQGAQQLLLGESSVVLAGGTESMSQAPHVVRGARWGLRLGPPPPLEDMLWEALRDVDAYAAQSQQRARDAWDAGVFDDEVVPVMVRNRKTKTDEPWRADEHMRPDTTPEVLAKLPPYFRKDGVVTAGNASGINDGAAAVVITTAAEAERRGLAPLGRLVGWGIAGVDPSVMGIGPAPAARKALARAGMSLDRMDLVEVNEAFAAQYLAVERELGLDRARTNVHGGAIAIGHPLAASGTRITLHLLHALRRGGGLGLGSACIGGGQGAAVIVEAFPRT